MNAGRLIHRVTVQTLTEASDGHDGLVPTWTDSDRVRIAARVEPLNGRDLDRARQVDPRASHSVTLRFWSAYGTDLKAGRSRLVFHDGDVGDRTLEIVEPPREVEPRVSLVMTCKEAA